MRQPPKTLERDDAGRPSDRPRASLQSTPIQFVHPTGEIVATTKNPDGPWVTQQASNLLMQLGEGDRRFKYLIRDRDSKFSFDFDAVFRSESIRTIRTPIRAPNANA